MATTAQSKPDFGKINTGKLDPCLAVNDWLADTYRFIQDRVLPPFQWPLFANVLETYQANRMTRGVADVDVFPTAACLAVGGTNEQAMPLAASWSLYIFAGRLFDDLADGEGGERFNAPTLSSKLSTCLFAVSAANAALAHLVDTEAYESIATAFSHAVGLAVKSENTRPTLDQLSLETYFATIAAKTGIIFATGAWAGGRMGMNRPNETVLTALYRYGLHVGMMTQIIDDCLDIRVDLANQVWTLPVIYAFSQETHPLRGQLHELLAYQQPTESAWLEKVVETLTQTGAISWSLYFAEIHRQKAWAAIHDLVPFPGYLRHYVIPKNK